MITIERKTTATGLMFRASWRMSDGRRRAVMRATHAGARSAAELLRRREDGVQ